MSLTHLVVIGVGSNQNPEANILRAREAIAAGQRLLRCSQFRTTDPIGDVGQMPYQNGVFVMETSWEPAALKEWLVRLEESLGRDRQSAAKNFIPIDLDLLIWDGVVLDTDIYKRSYLKEAVLEVLPDFIFGINQD